MQLPKSMSSQAPLTLSDYRFLDQFRTAMGAVVKGRKLLLDYYQKALQIQEKEKAGLVTEADQNCELLIKTLLAQDHPEVEFLGEESHFSSETQEQFKPSLKMRWILDPLDGTTNYVHRFDIYCISLAFEVKGAIEFGIIDCPTLGNTYTAIRGKGAYKNGRAIRVSQSSSLAESLVATGFFADNPDSLAEQLRIFAQLVGETRGVRRPGAAAYDLCMVAEGVFDLFWEKNLKPWDVAAGWLLVEEAGGEVKTYRNQAYSIGKNSIVAGNKFVAPLVTEKIQTLLEAETD